MSSAFVPLVFCSRLISGLISCCVPPIRRKDPPSACAQHGMLHPVMCSWICHSPSACRWRCVWGCPDPTGSRPLGFPQPRACGGPRFVVVAVGRFYRSQSYRLGPGLKHRERTAENFQQPRGKWSRLAKCITLSLHTSIYMWCPTAWYQDYYSLAFFILFFLICGFYDKLQ